MTQVGFTLRGCNPDVLTCIANLSNDEVFTPPDSTWRQLCLEAHYHALYARAGLTDVRTHRHDIGTLFDDAEAWWRVIWYAGFRGLVAQLGEAELARFKQEHLAEIGALHNGQGIPFNVTALFASGRVA